MIIKNQSTQPNIEEKNLNARPLTFDFECMIFGLLKA